MIAVTMPGNALASLLKPNETIEQGSIYIAKEISERTVWDKHAVKNPTHGAISAENEAAARKKSESQIAHIKAHLTGSEIVLDLGCGYGRVAQYVLPEVQVAGYIGLDSSYEMLTLFRQRYIREEAEQRTPALFLNADIHTIPLKDASVDTVIVCAVFLHNHKDVVKKALSEVRRVLKPGGQLLVCTSFPRAATAMGLQGACYQMLLNLLGKPFKNGPVRYYRKREILNLLQGFSEVDIVPVGFEIIPKTLIFLPGPIEKLYRVGFSKPVNALLEKVVPTSCKHYFAVHYDVVAK